MKVYLRRLLNGIVENKDILIQVGSSLIGALVGVAIASMIDVEQYDITLEPIENVEE